MSKITVISTTETKVAEGDGSLLEVCYDHDLPIPFGCQSGKCGICTVKVVDGNLAFDCGEGVRLACQAHVAGDVVLEPINE